jgi:Na+-transporting methylmalonyl-CoA/oxaloacetate decarboxylase gamma subunit
MFAFLIFLLLVIIAVSVVRNGHKHQEAVSKRTARVQAARIQHAGEAARLHTAYNKDKLSARRKEVGFLQSSREAYAEYKGTN